MSSIAIVAHPAAAGVAGLDGSFTWGSAVTGEDPPAADVRVVLGVEPPGGGEADAILAGDNPVPGDRVVATSGDGLWSRAAWPVRDELFDLPPPVPGAGVLVITPYPDRDAPLLEKLAARGIPVTSRAELTAEALATAATVAYPPSPDPTEERYVPGHRQEALPATVFAPLAAGRFLIAPRAHLTFGLLPGIDHLAASTDDDVVQYADTLHAFPSAFAPQAAFGRIAAERQRASVYYWRLAAEIEAEIETG